MASCHRSSGAIALLGHTHVLLAGIGLESALLLTPLWPVRIESIHKRSLTDVALDQCELAD